MMGAHGTFYSFPRNYYDRSYTLYGRHRIRCADGAHGRGRSIHVYGHVERRSDADIHNGNRYK